MKHTRNTLKIYDSIALQFLITFGIIALPIALLTDSNATPKDYSLITAWVANSLMYFISIHMRLSNPRTLKWLVCLTYIAIAIAAAH